MEKHLAVISGDQIHDVRILPGTTAEDVRRQLSLPAEFLLSRRDGLPFGPTEPIYGVVQDGEKLFASAPAVVGDTTGPVAGPAAILRMMLGFPIRPVETGSSPGLVRARPARRPSGLPETSESSRIIRRHSQPLWEERGWRQEGQRLAGWYRTRYGSYAGDINDAFGREPEYYIIKPPKALLNGPHGACFWQKGRHRYFVHWSQRPDSVNTGILRIEHALQEAMG
ncbi:MAG: hypothetical protein IT436_16005 [Phycisphaerales bacterium]|nr:hypothetical protein [Phycisphaerales bacterium]